MADPGVSAGRRCRRPSRIFRLAAGAAFVFATLAGMAPLAAPALRAQPPRPGSPAATTPDAFLVNGIRYIDARPFFSRYGLAGEWSAPGTRLVFSSRWSRIEIEHDKRDVLINGVKAYLGDAALVRQGTLYVSEPDTEKLFAPILRPAGLKVTRPLRTIVIDAGHGGKDTGTQNKALGYDEKNFTLVVARLLQAKLSGGPWRVLMTRNDDRFIDLGARSEMAAKAGADLFISIHFNAVAGPSAVKGTETFILTPGNQRSTGADQRTSADAKIHPGNAHDEWNALLGYQIQRHLMARLGSVDRGLKRARFAVLREAPCPAVLIEAGYLSNAAEARKIATDAYRQDIADSIAAAVRVYAAALDTAGK
ncbi:N-acetylmuramoyl-L-alanine amidase [Opitutaceae bacterium TAV1]|nr:N-acetylmuramoyl-L-alanine amidase [Opitutaceae bacterium TAV1]